MMNRVSDLYRKTAGLKLRTLHIKFERVNSTVMKVVAFLMHMILCKGYFDIFIFQLLFSLYGHT